jgi:hypothetical protein
MQRWERAAREFLAPWERRREVQGALACGSYVTGDPSPRSDVDVQILLAPGTRWRERGNRVVDGLLIEYFANSAKQLRAYFENDHAESRRVTATMFATGRVLFDRRGRLAAVVAEAKRWHSKALPALARHERERELYGIWDRVDNLLDAAERGAPDLAFQYHHAVHRVYGVYARFLRQPVLQPDRIFGCYRPRGRPDKYLLGPFPDPDFPPRLLRAIRETDAARMPRRLEALARHVTERMGGFEIDGWRLRTPSP